MRDLVSQASVWASAVVLVLLPSPATRAQEAELDTKIQVWVDLGGAHFRAGRYADAIVEYQKVLAVETHADILWNLARAYEETGDATNALHYFEQFVGSFPDDPSVPAARKRMAGLRERLPGWLVVDCGGLAAARVVVDASQKGSCGDRVGPLRPGLHVVDVTAPGRDPVREEVRVEPEGTARLEVVLTATPEITAKPVAGQPGADAPAAPLEGAPSAEEPGPPEPSNAPAWIAAGAGLALTGVAVVGVTWALEAMDQGQAARDEAETAALAGDKRAALAADRRFDEHNDAVTLWSGVGVVAGVLAFAAGATAAYLATSSESPEAGTTGLGLLVVRPDGWLVGVTAPLP